jgi:hypothetical protein
MADGDEKWFEVVSFFDGEKEVELGEVQGHKVIMRGEVGDLKILQIDMEAVGGAQMEHVFAGVRQLIESTEGLEKTIITPAIVEFMKLREVGAEEMKALLEKGEAVAQ